MSEVQQAAPDALDLEIKAALNVEEATTQEAETKPAEVTPSVEETPVVESSEIVETDNYKKRIDKITAEKYHYKRDADALRLQVAELTAKPQPVEPIAEVSAGPKLEDFKDEDYGYDDAARIAAYTEALTDHKVTNTLNKQFEARAQQESQAQERAKAQEVSNNFSKQEVGYSVENPTYINDVANLPIFQPDTLSLVMQQGPKVAHYLSKNPEIADQVANSDFGNAAMTIGRLSAQLENTKPKKQSSAAPEPIEAISGGGGLSKDIGEMSMEEIMNI
jgi:hypothetical protein